MKITAFLAALALVATTASAATSWTGTQSNDWFDPLNWSAGVPTSTVDATINLTGVNLVNPSQAAQSLLLGVTNAQTGSLTITSTVSTTGGLTVGSGFFLVGDFGTGTLTLSGGATIASGISSIADNIGSHGMATVTGAGSTWTVSSLDVGSSGAGELDILAGGHVTGSVFNIGHDVGASGTLIVSGIGSALSGSTSVGGTSGSTGELDILAGATMSGFLTVGGDTGNGNVTVSGTGSSITSANVSVGSTATGGAHITLSTAGNLTVTGILAVGRSSATGTLTMDSAATASAVTFNLGTSGPGTLSLSDSGTALTVSGNTTLGSSTTLATLSVLNGASFSTVNFQSNNSTLLKIDGANSLLTATGNFVIGNLATTQSLQISAGGKLSTGTFTNIADIAGSNITVTISGTSSTWDAASQIGFAPAGHADMTVSSGGLLKVAGPASNANLNLAGASTGSATLTVKDAGSSANITGGIAVGNGVSAAVTVSNGGSIKSDWMQAAVIGTADILITGAGSLWDSTGTAANGVSLARGGTVTFQVLSGGEFRGDALSSSLLNTGQSTITISGANSKFSVADISMGAGAMTITVDDTATLTLTGTLHSISLAGNPGSTGTLNVGTGGLAGVVSATQLFGGSGTATLNFNHTDDILFPAAVNGSTILNQLASGKTTLTANGNTTGITTISAGALQLGNAGATGKLGNAAIVDNAALIINRSNSLAMSNTISGTGTVTFNGAGTTSFSGPSTYQGNTALNSGRLLALNTANSATGTGAVTVNALAILGGGASAATSDPVSATIPGTYAAATRGIITGPTTVKSTAILAPGGALAANTVGTLTLADLTLENGSLLNLEFNAANSLNDFVAVTSANGLTLQNVNVNLYNEGTTNPLTAPGTYHLLGYNGTFLGSADNLTLLNPDPSATYQFLDNTTLHTIDLQVTSTIPEPAALSILAIGSLSLLAKRRRKNS